MREPRERDKRFPNAGQGAVMDEKPIAVTSKARTKAGLTSQIQEAIRDHDIARLISEERAYKESYKEANDFDIGDDYVPEEDEYGDLDGETPADDEPDELDIRLADSLKRVFRSFGIAVEDSPESSAPVSGGEGGDTPAHAVPPNNEPGGKD